jgi:hypothetical protein
MTDAILPKNRTAYVLETALANKLINRNWERVSLWKHDKIERLLGATYSKAGIKKKLMDAAAKELSLGSRP